MKLAIDIAPKSVAPVQQSAGSKMPTPAQGGSTFANAMKMAQVQQQGAPEKAAVQEQKGPAVAVDGQEAEAANPEELGAEIVASAAVMGTDAPKAMKDAVSNPAVYAPPGLTAAPGRSEAKATAHHIEKHPVDQKNSVSGSSTAPANSDAANCTAPLVAGVAGGGNVDDSRATQIAKPVAAAQDEAGASKVQGSDAGGVAKTAASHGAAAQPSIDKDASAATAQDSAVHDSEAVKPETPIATSHVASIGKEVQISAQATSSTNAVSQLVVAGVQPSVAKPVGAGAPVTQLSGYSSARSEPVAVHGYEMTSPNRLEIGVTGGSYGWLTLRADLASDGSIQAHLRGSAETASALRQEAPEIASFVASQQVPLNRVSVEAVRSPGGNDLNAGANTTGGNGRNASSQGREQRVVPSGTKAVEAGFEDGIVSASSSSIAGVGTPLASMGGWLSVRV